jgi:hypothetical protein
MTIAVFASTTLHSAAALVWTATTIVAARKPGEAASRLYLLQIVSGVLCIAAGAALWMLTGGAAGALGWALYLGAILGVLAFAMQFLRGRWPDQVNRLTAVMLVAAMLAMLAVRMLLPPA